MSYRPYPNAVRALAQVERGRVVAPPTELQQQLAEQANAALEAAGRVLEPLAQSLRRNTEKAWTRAMDGPDWQPGLKIEPFPVGEYRMSTR
jgi:hypothetical protein